MVNGRSVMSDVRSFIPVTRYYEDDEKTAYDDVYCHVFVDVAFSVVAVGDGGGGGSCGVRKLVCSKLWYSDDSLVNLRHAVVVHVVVVFVDCCCSLLLF